MILSFNLSYLVLVQHPLPLQCNRCLRCIKYLQATLWKLLDESLRSS